MKTDQPGQPDHLNDDHIHAGLSTLAVGLECDAHKISIIHKKMCTVEPQYNDHFGTGIVKSSVY